MSTAVYLPASALILGYLALCWNCWRGYRKRLTYRLERGALLLVYASQGGTAERLALQSARWLRNGGQRVSLLPLNGLCGDALAGANRTLFVVSTTGEGEAPDNGALFARRYLSRTPPTWLREREFGLLALGDSRYAHFCGFGQALHRWLQLGGARSLFAPVYVDREDNGALYQWREQLVQLGARAPGQPFPDSGSAAWGRWRLEQRRYLNPGSPGAPVYWLRLIPEDPAIQWQAGDIAQIVPGPGVDHHQYREYSIASLPRDGAIELVVRQQIRPDGTLGLGSGWLTRGLEPGATLALRVRANPGFHPPPLAQPLILIGSGTGIAGLRAHLKYRARSGAAPSWLLFGERCPERDDYLATPLGIGCGQGGAQHLDQCFSRAAEPLYVQALLRNRALQLLQWLADGASVCVCGSRQGMAAGVDTALRDILGDASVESLVFSGRYRRDVY